MAWWVAVALAAEGEPVELTLAEALDRLHADGPDLVQARARAEAARGIARQAAAAWQPIVGVTGGYLRNDSEVELDFGALVAALSPQPPPGATPPTGASQAPAVPGPVVIQPLEVWNAALSVQVPLLAPSAWAEATAAGRAADGAGASAEEATLQLEAALVSAAASAEAAAGVVEAAGRAVEVAEAHLASTRVAVAAGTATTVDELAAQADVARRRSELASARSGLEKAREGLGGLLGVDGPVVVTLPEAPPVDAAAQPRPALEAAEAQVRSAKARVDAAWWRQFPTVSATGTALAQTEPFPTTKKEAWRVGVSATWTLYDGGFRYGRLHQARAEVHAAEALRTAEQLRVAREARDAERDVAVAKEQLTLAEEQSRLAAQAAAVAQRGLAAGTVSALQARDVETQAFQADIGVASARARLWIAQAALRRARGLDQRW